VGGRAPHLLTLFSRFNPFSRFRTHGPLSNILQQTAKNELCNDNPIQSRSRAAAGSNVGGFGGQSPPLKSNFNATPSVMSFAKNIGSSRMYSFNFATYLLTTIKASTLDNILRGVWGDSPHNDIGFGCEKAFDWLKRFARTSVLFTQAFYFTQAFSVHFRDSFIQALCSL